MKIALLYPEALDLARFGEDRKEFPPMGILIIGSKLEELGHYVKIFKINKCDLTFDFREFDIVGFSLSSSATYHMIKEARFKSLYNTNTKIIAGGVHATLFPYEVLSDLDVKVVCVGEGENIIEAIINSKSYEAYYNIPNIIFKHQNKVFKSVVRKESIKQWNLPARHLLHKNEIFLNDRLANSSLKMAHVLFSRGCDGGCLFCAVKKGKVIYQNLSFIEQELKILKEYYLIEGVAIIDNNFFSEKEIVMKVCDLLRRYKLQWSALSRIESINENNLIYAKDSGCLEIKFGVESGSQRLLNKMNKSITLNQIISALLLTKKHGINTKITLIHGFPDENYKSTLETLNFLKNYRSLIDRVSLIRFVPLPGSFVFNNPQKYHLTSHGLFKHFNDVDWSNFHIYSNNLHWWGSPEQYAELQYSYNILADYIDSEYNELVNVSNKEFMVEY